MSTKKFQGKFYPLQHQEFLKLNQILTQSELSVYLWLKTNNPFGGKLIEGDTQKIAHNLGISRRTVQRALVKLQEVNLIELVINKFKYRLKSKSSPDDNSSEIEDKSKVAMSGLSGDSKIASATVRSFERHQDRLDDAHVAEVSPVSLSSSETKSERELQTSKISKTYIDFKKTLSEDESENFFRFVKEAIKNFREPVQDIEAWLASKTKAGQNRWEVYYQKYQGENKASKAHSDSSSVESDARRQAIANYQKRLSQEKTGDRKTENEVSKSEFNRLLDNPGSQIKRIDQLENQSRPIAKPIGKYVSQSCEHLRNLRMKSFFTNESVQGGMA